VTLTISPVPRAAGSLLHIYVEDTTYADAPARVLLHLTRPADPRRDGTLVIDIDAPAIPPGVVCTVRAHLDLDGDNAISAGDYITTETYPCADSVVMRLHRVP
jgi:hypothetical protein